MKTVYVAMSGGVDSSVAAALLKQRGFVVVGVFMKPWQPVGFHRQLCLWQQDRHDALRVAHALGIPFKTWDVSRAYKKSVADYMIREYRAGRTPNPDVMCNKEIKFGLFLQRALKEGADYIATGHYVVLNNGKLYQAKDTSKDQSYFLWTLTPHQLQHCLFPIGPYVKTDVRKMAKRFGLPNHAKKDSQGVCFIGSLDMKQFLKKYIRPRRGKIIHTDGRVLGYHDGVYYYTIGQRHGLDIKDGAGPYYIVAKDVAKNVIVVGTSAASAALAAEVNNCNWLSQPRRPARLSVRIRYRAPLRKAVLSQNNGLKFIHPERAITSGQSAVFYRGRQVLGGGIIV